MNKLLREFISSDLTTIPNGCYTGTYPTDMKCAFCRSDQIAGILMVKYKYDEDILIPDVDHMVCHRCLEKLLDVEDSLCKTSPRGLYVSHMDKANPVDLFVKYLRFKPTVTGFTVEHNYYNDPLVCYFTGEEITSNDLYYLSVPVGGEINTVSGGTLIYQQSLLKDPTFKAVVDIYENLLCKDHCTKCGRPYFLDPAEYSYRLANQDLGEYLCPKCASSRYNSNPRQLRYLSQKCTICNTSRVSKDLFRGTNLLACTECMLNKRLISVDTCGRFVVKIYESKNGNFDVYILDDTDQIVRSLSFSTYPSLEALTRLFNELSSK